MVSSRNTFLLFALFLLFLAGISHTLSAQECTPETMASPPVDETAMPKSATESFENKFRFNLAWGKISDSCRANNPPLPLVEGQEKPAQWVYFWNFGDGTFSRDSTPEHAFPVGIHVVRAALKPIYSDDHDPLGYMVDTIVVNAIDAALAYPARIPVDSSIALNVNWAASRPGGRLIFALTYKKIREQGEAPRTVYLMFPSDEFEFVTMQSGPAPSSSFSEYFDGISHRVYAWDFSQVDNANDATDENSVFVELKVRDAVADLLPDTVPELLTSVKAMYKLHPVQKSGKVNLLGVSNADKTSTGAYVGDSGVENSSFVDGLDELTYLPISLNWASDPNAMSVYPAVLEPGATEAQLHYRVDFFNSGTATADTLRIDATIDNNQLNTGTLATVSTFPTPMVQSFQSESTLRWASDDANLLSLGQAQDVGFPDENAFGFVNFNMKTKPGLVFKEGDRILARAHIQMEKSEVTTNEAIVRVQSLRMAAPCMFGLKVYYNFRSDKEAFHRSGYNLALTARKALGKMPNPQNRYFFDPRIPKSIYPLFWWQAELGYGQTNLRNPDVDSVRLGHIDLTPVLLRFIAKKPELRFGNIGVKRGWGLSAGYTASFLLHGKNNGNKIDLSSWSFGQRLDHSFSVSLDLLNLIGRPGISCGFGWRWRNSAVTKQYGLPGTPGAADERAWYNHPFAYVHYTFSQRLRYELNGFK